MGELLNLLGSHRKMELLQVLTGGRRSKRSLRDELGISSSSLAQIAKEMVDLGLIEERGGELEILPKGQYVHVLHRSVRGHRGVLDVFGQHMNQYQLDIPDRFLARLHELDGMEVLERESEVYLPHAEFLEALERSGAIRGYTSFFFPQYIEAFMEFAESGKELEIVVSQEIFETLIAEYGEDLADGLGYENVGFYVSDREHKLSFVVAEEYFTLSLFLRDGYFDYKRDFVCRTGAGERWGRDLFGHLRARSSEIGREELLTSVRRR